MNGRSRRITAALLALATVTACSAPATETVRIVPSVARVTRATDPAAKIRHVVIIVQENRSFVNVFSGFPGADAPTTGTLPGGKNVALRAIPFDTIDPIHSFEQSLADVDGGKMDGFAKGQAYTGETLGTLVLSRLQRSLVEPYWSMAQQYTLADHMFPTEPGPSWTAHLDLIAGTTNIAPHVALIDWPSQYPYDCWAPVGTVTDVIKANGIATHSGPFPCFDQFRTMADTLDAAHVSWRYYAPSLPFDHDPAWSPFGEIANVRNGADWKNVVTPSPQVLRDIAAGDLAGVTWVAPDDPYSDHAGSYAKPMGPSWVAAIVNAIGNSKFWHDTAIVVVWDEWGGWYDDVVPPSVNLNGLGIRVGCIIISPYAKRHYVSHTRYEYGSILKFAEEAFGLPALGTAAAGYSDARANSLADSFDFERTPSPFTNVAAPYPPSVFLEMQPSLRPPDNE